MKCAVGSCKENDSKKKSSHRQHITFYSFPRDVEQRKLWVKFCKRSNTINPKRERICALHFKKDDFERNLRFEMGFSNRSSAKLKPGAVPTLESINTITNDFKTDKCERVNSPMRSDINENQGRERNGFSKSLAAVANREASAIKIVNEALTFEEENIPMTIIKKYSSAAAELKAPKVPILDTCDIKIEDEEVTVPTIETTAIKKEIETFTGEESVSPELKQATVTSIATSAIKIENDTIKWKVENTSKRTDIKTDSRECIGFSNRLTPALQLGTASITETNAIKLGGETFTCQTANTPTKTALNQQGSREQQPRTLEFIVFVPYRVQIRDPSI
ncbi:hypothetical protein DOY81_000613 [Sarcophaga bullata]|nr:hypothetical protein DOY81_000613 [Sarcophaga bullata]